MSNRLDIYAMVTRRIVAALERGVDRYELPWHGHPAGLGIPMNARTGRSYRGVNVISLWVAGVSRKYATHLWATYRQWNELDAQVCRNEKATPVVFFKEIEVEPEPPADDKNKPETKVVARTSWVFNAAQVTGFDYRPPGPVEGATPLPAVDAVVAGCGAEIRYGGSEAYYDPAADRIQMPRAEQFRETRGWTAAEAFQAVLLHELVHWSGANKRLDRDLSGRFGDDAYAMEELIAELGSAFLCATLKVTPVPREDHAAYLQNWLRVLKADNRAIFAAAAKAAQASDYLIAQATKG